VIRRLKKAGLTDIEDHIKYERCYSPKHGKAYIMYQKVPYSGVSATAYFKWDIFVLTTGIIIIKIFTLWEEVLIR